MSCQITVGLENGEISSIEGYSCQRGKAYAAQEVTDPRRMLTTTVRINNAVLPLLPVVSAESLPKGKIKDCADFCSTVIVDAPVKKGDIIIKDILGLGVDVVASRSMRNV